MSGFTAENYLSSQTAGISETIIGKHLWSNRSKPVPLWQRNQLSFFVTAESEPRVVELAGSQISDRSTRVRLHSEAINSGRPQTDWAVNPVRDELPEAADNLPSPEAGHVVFKEDRPFSGETAPLRLEPKFIADTDVTNRTPVQDFKERQDMLFQSMSLLALKTRPLQSNEYMLLSSSRVFARMPGMRGTRNPHVASTRNRPNVMESSSDDGSLEFGTDQPEITGFTVPFSFQASSGYRAETWFTAAARIELYKPVQADLSGERCDYLM